MEQLAGAGHKSGKVRVCNLKISLVSLNRFKYADPTRDGEFSGPGDSDENIDCRTRI